MTRSITQLILAPVLAIALLATGTTAWAQGTATSPFTIHEVQPGPIVFIGDPSAPIPIDLDPTGGPWSKSIIDPNAVVTAPGLLTMIETIENAGDEPWYDWHEHILPNAVGAGGVSTWFSVKLSVNGTPITFTSGGLGTGDLWLDTFSQPVLPGDILTVTKEVEVFPLTDGSAGPILRIQEYPTPEPASAALIAVGSLALLGRRKATT